MLVLVLVAVKVEVATVRLGIDQDIHNYIWYLSAPQSVTTESVSL